MRLLILLFLCFRTFLCAEYYTAVTYGKGARMGDWLISYIHAKWISFQEEIPLVYQPFPFSHEFALSQKEMHLDEATKHNFLVYMCPYFPESEEERKREPQRWENLYFEVDFDHFEFKSLLREMISPIRKHNLVQPPKDTINIAIHVREGGGFDPEETKKDAPDKLPPLSFYATALIKVLKFCENKPVYCHLFTDAKEPCKIVTMLQKQIHSKESISWGFRKEGNHHDANVIEDFFSFGNFDILIRPESNYSLVASILKDFAIVCTPVCRTTFGKTYYTGNVNVKINQTLLECLIEETR